MSIAELVTDWGGFEKLVASLHQTGEVTVEHNVTLSGRSGAPRQIDVLIRHKQGLYEHLIVAECKYWNSAVERLHVDALATTVREVSASKGVIFSIKGFQSGAVTQARHENIDLYIVRDLTAEEWGLPGRVVDLYLQIVQPSIGDVVSPGALRMSTDPALSKPINLNFVFGADGPESTTPTLKPDGNPGKSLERLLHEAAQKTAANGLKEFQIVNGGANCTVYILCPCVMKSEGPFLIPLDGDFLYAPEFTFNVALKITQSRLTIDRGKQFSFALALENFVTGRVSAASRLHSESAARTTLLQLGNTVPHNAEDIFVNGSLLRVQIKGYFPFEETIGLERVPLEPLRKPFVYVPPFE